MLRVKTQSRHHSNKKYTTWVEYIPQLPQQPQPQNPITGYYCDCPSGARTVGCCAHVASVLWYLGLARHDGYTCSTPRWDRHITDAREAAARVDAARPAAQAPAPGAAPAGPRRGGRGGARGARGATGRGRGRGAAVQNARAPLPAPAAPVVRGRGRGGRGRGAPGPAAQNPPAPIHTQAPVPQPVRVPVQIPVRRHAVNLTGPAMNGTAQTGAPLDLSVPTTSQLESPIDLSARPGNDVDMNEDNGIGNNVTVDVATFDLRLADDDDDDSDDEGEVGDSAVMDALTLGDGDDVPEVLDEMQDALSDDEEYDDNDDELPDLPNVNA